MLHHVYLTPGMFGFARLASFDYFAHVAHGLERRFKAAGHQLNLQVVDVSPTASIRRRAARLAEVVGKTAGPAGDIHLLGHSTGGLDARFVASPGSQFANAEAALRWFPRLRSITSMNAPHYGTPLASFFATAKGQRALHALSAFTIIGLSLGRRPLGLASMLISLVGRGDQAVGLQLRILDRTVDSLLGLVDEARGPEVRAFLDAIKGDQGAVLQASPEAMDLMVGGFEDRKGVSYLCTASMAPTPSPSRWLRSLTTPWRTTSLSLFTTLHTLTAHHGRGYPCGTVQGDDTPFAGAATEATLAAAFGKPPDLHANDGIVPLRSQLWGTLLWAGLGDHLDVLGHYRDDRGASTTELRHRDWLTSGSDFAKPNFESLLDAIAGGMLKAAS